MTTSESAVGRFFEFNSIAIVGISRKSPSLGKMILSNLVKSGYKGEIFLINPKAKEIEGRTCYNSIEAIPINIDVAVIITPAIFVLESILDSLDKRVRGVIIITAGFGEVSEKGKQLEKEFLDVIHGKDTRIIGPNSMGTFSPGYHVSFSPVPINSGSVAYFSQSGSILANAAEEMLPFRIGFSSFISLGNKIDINLSNALPYSLSDKRTQIINLYMESFSRPEQLRQDLTKISKEKPIVMVKGGRTAQGARAASSHTGALAGEAKLVKSVLDSGGVISVDNIKDQVSVTRFLRKHQFIGKGGIALVSSAGGPSILAADEVSELGGELANFSVQTREKLRKVVPNQGSSENPIDLLASADEQLYVDTIRILQEDPDISAIIVIIVHPVLISTTSLLNSLEEFVSSPKPVICAYLGPGYTEFLDETELLVTGSTKEAIKMINGVSFYSKWRDNLDKISDFSHLTLGPKQDELLDLLSSYGLDIAKEVTITSKEEWFTFSEFNYPVVMKIDHPKYSHKSDVGGIILNIRSDEDFNRGWNKIMSIYETKDIPAKARSVKIQQYFEEGFEIALGIIFDELFGHFLMVGTGGTLVEMIEDVEFHPSPVSRYSANIMIDELKISKLFNGFRQYDEINKSDLVDIIMQLDNLVYNNPEIKELDINPLLIQPDGRMVVVDARVEYF